MAASIVIVILVLLIFGSSPIIESVLKMRRMKKGEDIIKEPWQEIHDIPGMNSKVTFLVVWVIDAPVENNPIHHHCGKWWSM